MRISMIVAMDHRGLIGDESGMPWRLSNDLKHFRTITWGKPIILGRRTFELIGKPLPGRLSIILTRKTDFSPEGCRVAHDLPEALAIARDHLVSIGLEEVMIVGGAQVYAEAISLWDRLYLTLVHGAFEGTSYFPLADLMRQRWKPSGEEETHPADEKNSHEHSFYVLERDRHAETLIARAEAELDKAPHGMDLVTLLKRGGTV